MKRNNLSKKMLASISMVFCLFLIVIGCSSDDDNGEGGNNPVISDFSPKEGEAGVEVTITGSNLSNASRVQIGDTEVPIVSNSDTEIRITVIEGTTPGFITVVTPGGANRTDSSFNVIVPGAVVISDIIPRSAEPGGIVTLTAEKDVESVNNVKIGGVDATFEIISDTEMNITVGDSPLGLSTLEITNSGGTLITDPTTEEFYVVSFITPNIREDFEKMEAGDLIFTTGSDDENDTDKSGWSPDITPYDLYPSPIDGNFYTIGGTSDTSDSGSFAGQIGMSQVDAGTFSEFFAGANTDLASYYFNIQINFQGIPDGYGIDEPLAGIRVRFDVPGIDLDGDNNTGDQYMEYRPSIGDLTTKMFSANTDGWYSISIPFDAFRNSGESGGSWGDYNVEANVTRFAIAARRNHEGPFSMSIDNISITKGGPIFLPNAN